MRLDCRAVFLATIILVVTACATSSDKPLDPINNDLVYLTQLGLMRGHLLVGKSLYDDGFAAAAKTHMKHPKSELYAALEPALRARGDVGFATELERLAMTVERDQSRVAVNRAYDDLLQAMAVAEQAAPTHIHIKTQFKRVVALLNEALEEYNEGVVNGVTVMPHEYQDAFGFTQVAKQILSSIRTESGSDAELAIDQAMRHLNTLDAAWPSLMPPENVDFDSRRISTAAAHIDHLAANL